MGDRWKSDRHLTLTASLVGVIEARGRACTVREVVAGFGMGMDRLTAAQLLWHAAHTGIYGLRRVGHGRYATRTPATSTFPAVGR